MYFFVSVYFESGTKPEDKLATVDEGGRSEEEVDAGYYW